MMVEDGWDGSGPAVERRGKQKPKWVTADKKASDDAEHMIQLYCAHCGIYAIYGRLSTDAVECVWYLRIFAMRTTEYISECLAAFSTIVIQHNLHAERGSVAARWGLKPSVVGCE